MVNKLAIGSALNFKFDIFGHKEVFSKKKNQSKYFAFKI